MKALGISHEISDLSEVELLDVDVREPTGTEVLVEVHSVGVNPADFRTMMLKSQGQSEDELIKMGLLPRPLPVICGYDFSGVIVKVGVDVRGFKVGDEVYGRPPVPNNGAFCEYYTIDEKLIAPKPISISHSQAATIPIPFQTVYINLVMRAQLKAGQSVLILGGAGGVGSIAVQVAKDMGARVFATGLSKDIKSLKQFNIDGIIDVESNELDEVAEKFDVMFDTVGIRAQQQAIHLMKDGGTVVSSVATDPDAFDDKALNVIAWAFANGDGNMLLKANEMIARGTYRPSFQTEHDFTAEGFKQALETVWTNTGTGRQVIKFKD